MFGPKKIIITDAIVNSARSNHTSKTPLSVMYRTIYIPRMASYSVHCLNHNDKHMKGAMHAVANFPNQRLKRTFRHKTLIVCINHLISTHATALHCTALPGLCLTRTGFVSQFGVCSNNIGQNRTMTAYIGHRRIPNNGAESRTMKRCLDMLTWIKS